MRPELLLQQQIPIAMHGVSPRLIIGGTLWKMRRDAVYELYGHTCAACGRKHKDGLEAHECYDIDYKKCVMTFKEIVGLCFRCHRYIHPGHLKSLVRDKIITEREAEEIIKRGNKILVKAGLFMLQEYPLFDNWSKWRLIFEGKEYRSKFRNYAEWEKRYAS
jgi:hypothetical protein